MSYVIPIHYLELTIFVILTTAIVCAKVIHEHLYMGVCGGGVEPFNF